MKNSKQVNLNTSVIATLDRIREQLPKRGTLEASYGDAIEYFHAANVSLSENNHRLMAENERLLHENIGLKKQKKVRK